MEVIEDVVVPSLVELTRRICLLQLPPRGGAESLGLPQNSQAPHGLPFQPGERSVAAGEDTLQITGEKRRLLPGNSQRFVKPIRRAVDDGDTLLPCDEIINAAQVLARGPAAVIADAPEHRHIAIELERQFDPLLQSLLNVMPLSVIQPHHNPQGQDFRAVQSAPAIQVGGQVQLGRLGRM